MVKLVGILNVTPDSFSDGGKFIKSDLALAQAERLFLDGASIVDVGAESTRPGATPLTAKEEWARLEKILPELVRLYPGKISLDTYHPETAARALKLDDAIIINDISGLQNSDMFDLIISEKASCVVGSLPALDAQSAHHGKLVSDIKAVVNDLEEKYSRLIAAGLPARNIILDPCIGFGKTPELNWQLIEIAKFLPGKKVMIGYSRKRFLGEDRMDLKPNLAAADKAVASGATYLRVHDVAGHAEHFDNK